MGTRETEERGETSDKKRDEDQKRNDAEVNKREQKHEKQKREENVGTRMSHSEKKHIPIVSFVTRVCKAFCDAHFFRNDPREVMRVATAHSPDRLHGRERRDKRSERREEKQTE